MDISFLGRRKMKEKLEYGTTPDQLAHSSGSGLHPPSPWNLGHSHIYTIGAGRSAKIISTTIILEDDISCDPSSLSWKPPFPSIVNPKRIW